MGGKRLRTAIAAVAVSLLVAACGGPDAAGDVAGLSAVEADFGDGPWAEEFERAFNATDSQFVRSVLADGEITEREWTEAMTGVAECMTLEGFAMEPNFDTPGGTFTLIDMPATIPPGWDEEMSIVKFNVCWPHWFGSTDVNIQSLWLGSQINPLNLDPEELLVVCLIDEGLAPQGFSAAEFLALESEVETMWLKALGADGTRFIRPGEWAVIDTSNNIHPIPLDDIPAIPLGASMSDPGVEDCRAFADIGH